MQEKKKTEKVKKIKKDHVRWKKEKDKKISKE